MRCIPCPPDLPPPAPCALQQHPRYASALSAIGATVQRLAFYDADRTIGQTQIVTRCLGPLRLNWLPRGPLWAASTDSAHHRAAVEALHGACRGQWLASPDTQRDADMLRAHGYRALVTPQHVAELDLNQPENKRLAAQHGKWRNRLRRALDHAATGALHISSRAFDAARDTRLLEREQAQRRARRYAALPAAFTHAWAATAPDAARIYLAQHNGRTVAFMMVLDHPPSASYHIGWTSAQGRSLMAHHLLLWYATNACSARGLIRLGLGAVDTHTTPGLARLKIGTGAHIRPLGPTMIRLRL